MMSCLYRDRRNKGCPCCCIGGAVLMVCVCVCVYYVRCAVSAQFIIPCNKKARVSRDEQSRTVISRGPHLAYLTTTHHSTPVVHCPLRRSVHSCTRVFGVIATLSTHESQRLAVTFSHDVLLYSHTVSRIRICGVCAQALPVDWQHISLKAHLVASSCAVQ